MSKSTKVIFSFLVIATGANESNTETDTQTDIHKNDMSLANLADMPKSVLTTRILTCRVLKCESHFRYYFTISKRNSLEIDAQDMKTKNSPRLYART